MPKPHASISKEKS